MLKRILILVSCAALAGCGLPHFKYKDSQGTLLRDEKPIGTGDPYTFAGIAEGSGGQITRTSHPTDTNSPDMRDTTEVGKIGKIDEPRTRTPDVPRVWRSGNDEVIIELPGATTVQNAPAPGH
jgi:hypothetical protein